MARTSNNKADGGKASKKGRCADCRNAEPLGDFSMRCKIYKVGKAKGSLRICDHYEAK